ncbi:Plant self-incompatibility S1 [Vigna unguiculata]|uniref:Plant self-incompatibility S1 n=1 Tax=Vigna unguiculata TaxID=3917 RepID=A0A4D6LQC2_VIGUN|nr:Plant self-incompatibility S1 [Vigna unguiculata]
MAVPYGGGKALFIVLFLMMDFAASSQASNSMWGDLLHPKLEVNITSKIPGEAVNIKCISSENDIKRGLLDSSTRKPFTFDVQLKLLTTIRYNCLLTQGRTEIGQFLGFRSGTYCEKGCIWELHRNYALRMSSREGYVNQTYKPIGSPDDYDYDYSR